MPYRSSATRRGPRLRGETATAIKTGFADAMIAAALLDLTDNRTAAAIARLRAVAPEDADGQQAGRVALAFATAGAATSALPWFDRALALAPPDPDLLAGKGRALAALGRPEAALDSFRAAAAAGSDDPAFHLDLGNLLRAAGDRSAAIAAYDEALRLRPAFPEALRAAGAMLRELGNPAAALRFLGEALRLAPDDRQARLDRTDLLQALGRFDEALADYDEALARDPRQADLLTNRGVALQQRGELAAARASFEAAVAVDPGLAPAWLNLGNALLWFGEGEGATAALDRALALRPLYAEALCSRGVAHKACGRFAEAAADFDAALAAQPDLSHAKANRGELRLLLGHLQAGWAEYEDRFQAGRQTRPVLNAPVPHWTGIPRPRARIAVLADQGNGDMIQFARYLPLLADRGFEVTFLCPARLHRLFDALTLSVRTVALIAGDEVFDVQIALSSLPWAFATSLDTIPAWTRYLVPERALVRRWAARIGALGLRVGLCWRGSQNWQADPRRSLPLATLAPLAAVPGVRLFSLQLPDNTGDEDATMAALGIDPLGAELDRGPDAFLDTAAAMDSVDLVVTCDTAIAHLAGALGRPVFVLLQSVPEWRWMLHRDDSPWYPAMRLFRQVRSGSWDEPVAAVAAAVRMRAAALA